ncbi:/ ffh / signal recognition particle srp54-like protein /:157468 Forward [Candidatus Hepatoplasma crinochetorum]|uniref:signal-recognition-particle GTPase n=1 Tax=Candidatus Hepatoplasma crinochetorum TaxID=295596 RepID=A0A0G7ZNN7_9MOLU|nr:/ ffh / signal recognition particle srp54-like protein /:157468 Forward [Candidatus Hepatoplasma crinochetorum]
MVFNFMQKRLEKTIRKVQSKGMLNKENIEEILKEVRLILLESDVNLKVANDFIDSIEKKAIGKVVDNDRTSSQEILKIIYDELVNILGKEVKKWNFQARSVVMMVGLQGSGKTTTVAKLANNLFKKEKKYKKPLLVGLDIYRPAAIDQLEILAKKIDVDFYSDREEKDVAKLAQNALKFADQNNHDLIILDTAGRLQTDQKLMEELQVIKKIFLPTNIIFVADGFSGQEILNVAEEFNNKLKLSSIIVTKMDSNTKGGSIFSLAYSLKVPISYLGTGEKIANLEIFYPNRIASRILGLGDIETLTEKAQELGDEKAQEKMFRKMMAGKFDLDDLLVSMEQLSKMGNLGAITKLLPSFGKLRNISEEKINSAQTKLEIYKILINSMTQRERKNPRLLKHQKRKERILKGSGRTAQEYNDLLRQFERMQKQIMQLAKVLKAGKMPDLNKLGNGFF